MNKKIFVAAPFNGVSNEVKQERVRSVKNYCVKLFKEGHTPVSALLMGLTFAEVGGLPTDTNTWSQFCNNSIKGCDELHLLMLEGWDASEGVASEISEADKLKIKIKYIFT